MPIVNVRITRDGATSEQKARIIKGMTDVLVDVLGKDPSKTFIVIEEVHTDDWGVGGEQVTAIRAQATSKS